MLLIVCVGLAWMFVAKVPVYETTEQARIEVSEAAFPVSSLVEGRIVAVNLRLGESVLAGQSLVELDNTSAQLARSEGRARVEAFQLRHDAIHREISAEQATLSSIQAAREKGIQELKATVSRVQAQLDAALQDAERARKAWDKKAMSQAQYQKAQAKVDELKAALTESSAAQQRVQQEKVTAENECRTRIVRLERESVELAGQIRIEEVALERQQHRLKDFTVTAPVSGRLDEVRPLSVGTVVTTAQPLAVVVPAGQPRIVARFPVVVVGRLRPGQLAKVRLDGFPWTQYGTVPAEVREVGTEPIDGLVRVELALTPEPDSTVPIEHGLTGSVEIQVEVASPAVLVLRAAGQFLGTSRHQVDEDSGV